MTKDELRIDLHLRLAMAAHFPDGVDVDRLFYWRLLLKELSLPDQLVVILHVLRGLSWHQIDDFLNWNRIGTCRGARSKARWKRARYYLKCNAERCLEVLL
jgi:hypothetical protein